MLDSEAEGLRSPSSTKSYGNYMFFRGLFVYVFIYLFVGSEALAWEFGVEPSTNKQVWITVPACSSWPGRYPDWLGTTNVYFVCNMRLILRTDANDYCTNGVGPHDGYRLALVLRGQLLGHESSLIASGSGNCSDYYTAVTNVGQTDYASGNFNYDNHYLDCPGDQPCCTPVYQIGVSQFEKGFGIVFDYNNNYVSPDLVVSVWLRPGQSFCVSSNVFLVAKINPAFGYHCSEYSERYTNWWSQGIIERPIFPETTDVALWGVDPWPLDGDGGDRARIGRAFFVPNFTANFGLRGVAGYTNFTYFDKPSAYFWRVKLSTNIGYYLGPG